MAFGVGLWLESKPNSATIPTRRGKGYVAMDWEQPKQERSVKMATCTSSARLMKDRPAVDQFAVLHDQQIAKLKHHQFALSRP